MEFFTRFEDIVFHATELRPLIQTNYSVPQLEKLFLLLSPSLDIPVSPRGLVSASTRPQFNGKRPDPTHYDAVWVRDALWAHLALDLRPDTQELSTRILKSCLDYFAQEAQIARLDAIIKNPSLALDPVQGMMNVLHIRFDSQSETFEDVLVGGEPQKWNHKQNDALGLFYLALVDSITKGTLPLAQFSERQWYVLLRLPTYFEKTRFYAMEDSGPWEEIERINSSSVGLVTSALEALQGYLSNENRALSFQDKATALNLDLSQETFANAEALESLIQKGYDTLLKQLPFESPAYSKEAPQYREADAALLNLVYPARLRRLRMEHYREILAAVETLVREVGVVRYSGDSYQGGNSWLNARPEDDAEDSRTDDTSSLASFAARADQFMPGTEAQWFFDSWISKVCGILYRKSLQEEFFTRQTFYFNRALGQLTGGSAELPVLGADGQPVPAFAFPESYNVLIESGSRRLVPSPITPLNWAKASFRIAIDEMMAVLRLRNPLD